MLLARLLRAADHEVTVVTFYPGGPLAADLDQAGVAVRSADRRSRLDLVGFLLRVRRLIARTRPDVVYSSLAGANVVSALLSRSAGARAVVWRLASASLDLARYAAWTRAAYATERVLARRADLVVANSRAGLAHARARGFPDERLVLIPNGIDTGHYRPDRGAGATVRAAWGFSGSDVVAGMVARIDPMKDHETFLRAAALAGAADPRLRFVCVGDGESQRLRAFAAELGLADTLRWQDGVDDTVSVYNALDILCLSSRDGEGFPNVLGEAMSCGVPCVATDVGDAREIIGDAGRTVPPRDAAALAAAIGDVAALAAPARSELGCRGRTRVGACYSPQRMLERTLAAFDRALRATPDSAADG